jgi:hypothetical protein
MDHICPELAHWARDHYREMSWPEGRAVPPKDTIADYLEQKMAQETTEG